MGTRIKKTLSSSFIFSSSIKVYQASKMSAKAKVVTEKKATYQEMIVKAIVAIKDRRGCSRSAIARWIQINCEKSSGSTFHGALRSAIKKGLESGLFKEGNSKQRFRIGVLPKAPKKKVASKKKKTNSKKKKTASKKKSSKKKGSKKKNSSKKKAGSKKKAVTKKKTASKKKSSSKKKTGSKKKTSSKKK